LVEIFIYLTKSKFDLFVDFSKHLNRKNNSTQKSTENNLYTSFKFNNHFSNDDNDDTTSTVTDNQQRSAR